MKSKILIVISLVLKCYASLQRAWKATQALKTRESVDVQDAGKCDAATDRSSVRVRARVKETQRSNKRIGAQTSKTLLRPDSDSGFLDHLSAEELMQ